MIKNLVEVIGWYGVVAIIGAYALSSFQIIVVDSLLYGILNFTGAGSIVLSSYSKGNYQPVVLNAIWAVVAVIALLSMI